MDLTFNQYIDSEVIEIEKFDELENLNDSFQRNCSCKMMIVLYDKLRGLTDCKLQSE